MHGLERPGVLGPQQDNTSCPQCLSPCQGLESQHASSVSSPTGRGVGAGLPCCSQSGKGQVKAKERKLSTPPPRRWRGTQGRLPATPSLQPRPARDHRGGGREERSPWQFKSWTQGCQARLCPVALVVRAEAVGTDPDPGLGSWGGDNGSALPSSHSLKPALPSAVGLVPGCQ